MGKVTTLYRIYGERSVLLYVGITDQYETRMRSHSEKWWWREVRRIETENFDSRAEAKAAETASIKTESPLYNRAENEGGAAAQSAIPLRNTKVGARQMVTIDQAAEYAGVNPRTIRRRIADGSLPATRMGPRLIRVDLRDVEDMLRPIPAAGWCGNA